MLVSPAQPFLMTDGDVELVFSDPLYRALISAPRFQRLKQIRFLGAIDYLLHANGTRLNTRHTRYQHSLGVGLLATRLSEQMGWANPIERAFVAGALLHDIGHGPLSHSLEPVFRTYFQVDHHVATMQVITQGHAGEEPLAVTLAKFGVDTDLVIDMISNKAGQWSPFFLGKFNLDTLEGISRCETYMRRNPVSAPPWDILLAAYSDSVESQQTLDAFWKLKDLVYSKLIQSPTGVSADLNVQEFVRRHLSEFDRDHFFAHERELRRWHPRLFRSMAVPRWDRLAVTIRRFDVDAEQQAPEARYIERRQEVTYDFAFRKWDAPESTSSVDRLFHDERKLPGNR
jgi:hypothetical protein